MSPRMNQITVVSESGIRTLVQVTDVCRAAYCIKTKCPELLFLSPGIRKSESVLECNFISTQRFTP